ncbi:cylicin-2 [Diachasma alloeum]|uniref:cylicin-2 n=1 Tax=Diachasma alloeum TaxID=454923 RepID=UPI0007384C70|nr:cylicin-2 [Diachasma alloeum]
MKISNTKTEIQNYLNSTKRLVVPPCRSFGEIKGSVDLTSKSKKSLKSKSPAHQIKKKTASKGKSDAVQEVKRRADDIIAKRFEENDGSGTQTRAGKFVLTRREPEESLVPESSSDKAANRSHRLNVTTPSRTFKRSKRKKSAGNDNEPEESSGQESSPDEIEDEPLRPSVTVPPRRIKRSKRKKSTGNDKKCRKLSCSDDTGEKEDTAGDSKSEEDATLEEAGAKIRGGNDNEEQEEESEDGTKEEENKVDESENEHSNDASLVGVAKSSFAPPVKTVGRGNRSKLYTRLNTDPPSKKIDDDETEEETEKSPGMKDTPERVDEKKGEETDGEEESDGSTVSSEAKKKANMSEGKDDSRKDCYNFSDSDLSPSESDGREEIRRRCRAGRGVRTPLVVQDSTDDEVEDPKKQSKGDRDSSTLIGDTGEQSRDDSGNSDEESFNPRQTVYAVIEEVPTPRNTSKSPKVVDSTSKKVNSAEAAMNKSKQKNDGKKVDGEKTNMRKDKFAEESIERLPSEEPLRESNNNEILIAAYMEELQLLRREKEEWLHEKKNLLQKLTQYQEDRERGELRMELSVDIVKSAVKEAVKDGLPKDTQKIITDANGNVPMPHNFFLPLTEYVKMMSQETVQKRVNLLVAHYWAKEEKMNWYMEIKPNTLKRNPQAELIP